MDAVQGSPFATQKSLHCALNTTLHEIRVMELAPGDFDDDLVISLYTRRLADEDLQYDALSYVWGQKASDRTAIVDGHSVTIGSFLDCALRHLRHGADARVLWVDALCINQQDVGERSQQVQLMGSIYSSAQTVLIWLGPERQDDDIVLNYMRKEEMEIPQTESEIKRLFKALKRICRRPWFGRVWVVQELTLATRDPEVYLGMETVTWIKFYGYVSWIHKKSNVGGDWPLREDDGQKSVHSFWVAANRVAYLGYVRKLWLDGDGIGSNLSTQLLFTGECQATDPRDNVYGLLAITSAPSGQPVIFPDYTMSTCDVFARATFSMIQEPGCPFINFSLPSMHNVGSEQSHAVNTFPSWVLDLTITLLTPSVKADYDPYGFVPSHANTNALQMVLRGLPPFSWTSCDFKRLTTVGMYIGVVVELTGDLLSSDRINTGGYAQSLATTLYKVYTDILKPRRISERTFAHALTIDAYQSTGLIETIECFSRKRCDYGDLELQRGSPTYKALFELAVRRDDVIFVTSEGHVGVTHHPDLINGVRPGDLVVGLFGMNQPFILRLTPESTKDNPMYRMINVRHIADHQWGHEFVEEAAQKVKNGEKPPEWSEFEKFGLKEYTIV